MMNHLPNTFQFRIMKYPGFTHSAKLNDWGDYEVKWARGYAQEIKKVPDKIVEECWFEAYLGEGLWEIVEDKPKQKEQEQEAGKLPDRSASLPDLFCFQVGRGAVYQFTKVNPKVYNVVEYCDRNNPGALRSDWPEHEIMDNLENGLWKVCEAPKELTAEQQRTVSQYREQIAALDSSIRINEQTVEHHLRLIGNYKQRQEDLQEKICEITGEESPKMAKAKAMKVELEKLKGSV